MDSILGRYLSEDSRGGGLAAFVVEVAGSAVKESDGGSCMLGRGVGKVVLHLEENDVHNFLSSPNSSGDG